MVRLFVVGGTPSRSAAVIEKDLSQHLRLLTVRPSDAQPLLWYGHCGAVASATLARALR